MSKSHLNSINDLLKKKTLSQAQVEEIEMHFREMLDIQEVNDNRQGIINKRQNVFDEFQKQVNDEGTCVITLTPEELNPKGIRCQQTFAKQATEAAQAVNAWFRATAELSLNLYDILSDTWIDKYANTTDTTKKDKKQEAQAIEPHEPVDFLDTMERGESGYQGQVVHPTHEEESVTTASEQEEDEYLLLSTEYFDPNDVRSRSSTSSTTSTLTLASSGELDSNETVNLTLVINHHGCTSQSPS
ncbi:MAG: hypothetical protein GW760_05920, partial [Legionella sp.]|nr:hypothetical protein [Legionella sp.]